MIKLDIKPLSINDAWKGRRFKTDEYKKYEKIVLLLLPKIKMPLPPYDVKINFCFSSTSSDIDNPVKPFLDILQKKYNIDDKNIHNLTIKKTIVAKGKECINFEITQTKI